MKRFRMVLIFIAGVLGLVGVGRFFVSQLTTGPIRTGPAGVILAPPPDVLIEALETTDRMQAAHGLSSLRGRHPTTPRLGVHFSTPEHELYWIIDHSTPSHPLLIERAAGLGGTRVETQWHGGLEARLDWARENGTFEAPGWPPGERRNLYH